MNQEEWVYEVIHSFYDKAKTDILIGYHFRNIIDFEEHIPRIASFWELQLFGKTSREIKQPFDVIKVHIPLGIKKGELGRWLLLFRKTLEEKLIDHPEMKELKELWENRLKTFEGIFSRFFGL